jgi:hypothetical protein
MGSQAPRQIDRVQDLTGSISLNREKIKEVGRDGVVGYKPATPQVSVSVRQLEYGSLDFWRDITNQPDSVRVLTHNSFKDSAVDITGYKTNDAGVFDGTVVYPKLRTNGFSVAIGDPDALIERNFSLSGEDEYIYQGNNKYYIQLQKVVETGEAGTVTIVIGASGDYFNYPTPVADPDNPTKYFQRLTRERAGTVTELVEGTGFTYVNGTETISVPACQVGDIIKAIYTASDYITGENVFVNNDVDLAGISADSCSMFLNIGTQVYALQSASFDVAFERADQKEIGNKEVVVRGVKSKTITIQLGRILNGNSIEEILRGVAASYGKIDAREFADDIRFTLKIYSDNTKSTFLMGYEFKNLTPSALDEGAPVDDYATRNVTITGEELLITDDEAQLGL